MTDLCLEDLLSAVILPVLPEAVFGSHETTVVDPDVPWPQVRASSLWCGDYWELQARHPRLPQAHNEGEEKYGHGCADLMVETDDLGRLERADFELHGLPDTFAHLGDHASAARAAALYGRPAREAAYALATLLEVMFTTSRAEEVI